MIGKLIKRGLIGFMVGVCVSLAIPLIISYYINDGYFHPVVPSLIDKCGNELNATVLQYLCSGIMGFGTGAGFVIYENEKISLFIRTVISFSLVSVFMLPVAYICHWMEHSMLGFVTYFSVFALMYFIIWIIEYIVWRHIITKMNKALERQ